MQIRGLTRNPIFPLIRVMSVFRIFSGSAPSQGVTPAAPFQHRVTLMFGFWADHAPPVPPCSALVTPKTSHVIHIYIYIIDLN